MKKISLAEYAPKDYQEIFADINTRQITALMFHDEMADLFDFLGLRGFKRMHEYQYLTESCEHRALKRYYINHHGRMLYNDGVPPVEVIPEDWYQYDRMEVPSGVRKQSVQKAMEQYKTWESDTKALYEKCAMYLLNWGHTADFHKVQDLVRDVDVELKYLERLCLELKAVDYSSDYLFMLQDRYHDEYEKKCKEIGANLC